MSADLLSTLAAATGASSVAILIVLLLRKPLRVFGAQTAYAVWALIPLSAGVALLPAPTRAVAVQLAPAVMQVMHAMQMPIDGAAAAPSFDTAFALFATWLIGVGASIALLVRQQRRFIRGLGRLDPAGDDAVRAESTAGCPALVGAWRPRIVLPADFERRYDDIERRLVLAHERSHRRRGDAQINALAAALRCLFWFNPLFHFAASRFRFDQELACDAVVIAKFPAARRSYADAMLKTQLADSGLPAGCHWQSSHPLKERIAMLKKPLPSRARSALGALTAVALIGAGTYAAWAAQPAAPTALGVGAAADGSTIEATVVLSVDGQPTNTWTSQSHSRFMRRDASTPPAAYTLRNPAGAPFDVRIANGAESWGFEATATPAAENAIRLDGVVKHNDAIVSRPTLITHQGEPAAITLGEQRDGEFKGLAALITLARLDSNTAAAATSAVGDAPARYRSLHLISYPAAALGARKEAIVYLKLHIGSDGSVATAVVDPRDGLPDKWLAEAAVDGVKTWKFEPATRHGTPVASDEIVPIVFTLSPLNAPKISGATLDAIRVGPPAEPKSTSAETPPSENVAFRQMYPPHYPAAAVVARQSGKLVFKVLVDEHGVPQTVAVERSEPPEAERFFAQGSIDTIKQWRFNPGLKQGKPYPGYVLVPIDYSVTDL